MGRTDRFIPYLHAHAQFSHIVESPKRIAQRVYIGRVIHCAPPAHTHTGVLCKNATQPIAGRAFGDWIWPY